MTTISNLLGVRLGSEMCRAIGAILQLVPKAFYAPIGKVSDEDKKRLLKTFEDLGVADRVKFLGPHINPSQIARCMKLYLNEFPFGSCFGMLDAMASGCVVVSMHDPNGPAQARYGAEFMGSDRVIAAGHDKDYIALAVSLLTDPNLYQEWSDHTLKQYALHADEVQYVKKFEEILLNSFKLP
jgi:predicted O-linked N-acetylglucosamine transferase (SPINDLY family)